MNGEVGDTFVVSEAVIKGSPIGEELSREECTKLAAIVSACALREGGFLLEEGHVDDSVHVLTSGRLGVVKPTGGGDWVTLQVLEEGDMVGEMGFIDGVEHSAGVRALSYCEVFSIQRGDFEALLVTDPELVYKVMRAIMRTVHGLLRRMNLQYVEMTNYITKQHGRY